ncbi:MAG TPA: exodeoxyribonuclease VII large subunit, partial [Actinomycetes bacterium]|nr:exodeoxyribonuclease VII large subunit [Actinomycetes bacterium]
AVQGAGAAAQVTTAIKRLDADASVDVIIVTRGGGSAEDLLPFSEETLLRAVASCATPLVSAIGHEQDTPLLDLVADVRASTPTDAARRVVPDFAAESSGLRQAHQRLHEAMAGRLRRERDVIAQLRGRPVLAAPHTLVDAHEQQRFALLERSRRALHSQLERAQDGLDHTRARVKSLSPQATLDRGYAVVQLPDGAIVREPVGPGTLLRVRVADGAFDAVAAADS